MPTDPTREKWERRRASRRAEPAEPPEFVYRPRCLDWSFRLWLVIGVPLVLALWGILIIYAAHAMRNGHRRARTLLTVIAAPSFLTPISVLYGVMSGGEVVWLVLVPLVAAAILITATVLMHLSEADEFFAAVRR